MKSATLLVLLAVPAFLAAAGPLRVVETETSWATWLQGWVTSPPPLTNQRNSPTPTPAPCIKDGMCCGGDFSVCCSGGGHATLKCGLDECQACETTVQNIQAHAAQGCDSIGPTVCGKLPAAVQPVCEQIVSKSCQKVLQLLDQGLTPEKVCESLGFCGAGSRCGCLEDGACADKQSDCCSGKIHGTAKCPGTAAGGGRCGCVPSGQCANVPEDCCGGSFHKTLKCGGGLVGGRCN